MPLSVHELRGVTLEVHERGAGATVVYVHGEDGLMFSAPLLHELATHASMHAPVLPGWSDSRWPAHCTNIDDLAIVLLDYLRVLDEPVVLVGTSLGGWVVAEALVRDTSLVRGAVLVALGDEAARTGEGPILHGDPGEGEAHVVHGAHVESARLNLEWATALGVA